MEKQQYIDRAEHVLYKLYDTDGQEYLDFGAGIAVMGLGYSCDEVKNAVKEQMEKLPHISNLFYNEPAISAGEKLLAVSQMDKVFFTNSGTEAIEGALKIAKRYAYNKGMAPDYEIIAMKHSFHGRSLGALSLTGNDHYQEPFAPLIPNIKFAEHDALLMLDEIQCGMGRSGEMFAWQDYGVKPDVMTTAKALGNGTPVGAFLACGKAATAMVPGDHGTTYGGNPLVCAAANAVLDVFKEKNIVGHVKEVGAYLYEKLEELVVEYDCVIAHRGKGLIQGLEFNSAVGPVVTNALLEQHLVLISAGANIIRFVPPLVIEQADVDEMVVRLKAAIEAVMK